MSYRDQSSIQDYISDWMGDLKMQGPLDLYVCLLFIAPYSWYYSLYVKHVK